MSETEVLANYVARANYKDLPTDVIRHAKESISDTIACGLGGRKSLEGDILIRLMKDIGGKAESTVFGEKTRLSFTQAAQVNSVLANILDYDDTLIKIGHMGSMLVPVALSIGERFNASGKDVINSIVLGYEVIIRLRKAVEPSEEAFWKTFERVGSGIHFGVTVVAGKLMGLNGGQIADAFGLTGYVRASRVALPDTASKGMPRWMKVTQGDLTIPGIHAALLAKEGFLGDRGIFDQDRGYEVTVGSDCYDAKKLTENLSKKYGMLRVGYKFYPSCRHISATLDAVVSIVSENQLMIEDIKQIIVRVQNWVAHNFAIYEPVHMIQAQFSIPYAVSMVLMEESPGPGWYTEEMLRNPKARELQHKVKIEGDPALTRKYYVENKYASKVEIVTKEGRRFKKDVDFPKGVPENPFTLQDHRNKLSNMASWLGIKQIQIEELIQRLEKFEELETLAELTHLLVPQ